MLERGNTQDVRELSSQLKRIPSLRIFKVSKEANTVTVSNLGLNFVSSNPHSLDQDFDPVVEYLNEEEEDCRQNNNINQIQYILEESFG